MTTALYIGRFQPFHKGHLKYLKKIMRENDFLKLIIGSSQEKNTFKNPFSVVERKKMILGCLKAEKIPLEKIEILTAADCPGDDKKWLDSILKKAGKFDLVYAGENKIIYRIFMENGFKVDKIKRLMGIIGTKVRKLILQGKEWKHLVPESVYEYLKKIDGEERIKKAMNSRFSA